MSESEARTQSIDNLVEETYQLATKGEKALFREKIKGLAEKVYELTDAYEELIVKNKKENIER